MALSLLYGCSTTLLIHKEFATLCIVKSCERPGKERRLRTSLLSLPFPFPHPPPSLHTLLPPYIPSSLPTYPHPSLHTLLPPYIPSSLPTYPPPSLHTLIPPYIPSSLPTYPPPPYIPSSLPTYPPPSLHTLLPPPPPFLHTLHPSYIPSLSSRGIPHPLILESWWKLRDRRRQWQLNLVMSWTTSETVCMLYVCATHTLLAHNHLILKFG